MGKGYQYMKHFKVGSVTGRRWLGSLSLLGCMVLSGTATAQQQPQGWSLGTGLISTNASYRGMSSDTFAIPFIGYESDTFYVRGLQVGYNLRQERTEQLSVGVTGEPFRFRPRESAEPAMQELDRRGFGASLNLSYSRLTRAGSFGIDVNHDLTFRHNGQRVQLQYSFPLSRSRTFQFTPRAGLRYYSKDYTSYYFSVSPAEAERSGLSTYQSSHAVNPYVGVFGFYAFTDRWSMLAFANLERNHNQIVNSPMVDGRTSYSLVTAITYRF